MSVQPHITASVGVPRAISIKFPAGNQVGESGKPIQQKRMLLEALESIYTIKSPNTILESPYKWRRFPINEEAVYTGSSSGPQHLNAIPIGLSIDELSDKISSYQAWLNDKLASESTVATPNEGYISGLKMQIERVDDLMAIVDDTALDQYREIINSIATLELRGQGKFV